MTRQTSPQSSTSVNPFAHPTYVLRKKVFKIFGDAFHIFDPSGQVVIYSKLKAFRLREDIRLYSSEDMQHELLRISARQIIDFSAAYDVIDSTTNQKVGALQRRGFKSMVKDEWMILDAMDRQIGVIVEDSTGLALLRRFIDFASLLFPQQFHASIGGQTVCTFQQNYNPFVRKLTIDFSHDSQGWFDRRLGFAAAVLLAAIEGRQG
jgi:hypothetical protein